MKKGYRIVVMASGLTVAQAWAESSDLESEVKPDDALVVVDGGDNHALEDSLSDYAFANQVEDDGLFRLYFPIHATGLKLEAEGFAIEQDVGELAKLASEYFTLGLSYEKGNHFVDYNVWYGRYGGDVEAEISGKAWEQDGVFETQWGLVGGIPLPDPSSMLTIENVNVYGGANAGISFDMDQTIHSFNYGYKFYEQGGFSLHGTTGFRYYDQEMRFSNLRANLGAGIEGEITQSTRELGWGGWSDWEQGDTQKFSEEGQGSAQDSINSIIDLYNRTGIIHGGEPIGAVNLGVPDSIKVPMNWYELTLGLEARYQFTEQNMLKASYSYGHKESYRAEILVEHQFQNNWFVQAGWRQDYFKADGLIDVEESGALLTVGYEF